MNKYVNALRLMVMLPVFLSLLSVVAYSQTSPQQLLTSQLCGVVEGIRTVIGFIALVMFLVGGVLYAGGHFMPAAGNIKSSMQGWAMGMIVGGVLGIVLVILAPYIVNTIINFSSATGNTGGSITSVTCP